MISNGHESYFKFVEQISPINFGVRKCNDAKQVKYSKKYLLWRKTLITASFKSVYKLANLFQVEAVMVLMRTGTPTMAKTYDDTVRSDTELKISHTAGMSLHALVVLDEILKLAGYSKFSSRWVSKFASLRTAANWCLCLDKVQWIEGKASRVRQKSDTTSRLDH